MAWYSCHRSDRIRGIYSQFVSKQQMAFLSRSVIRKVFIGAKPFRRDIRYFGVCFISHETNLRPDTRKYENLLDIFH